MLKNALQLFYAFWFPIVIGVFLLGLALAGRHFEKQIKRELENEIKNTKKRGGDNHGN